MKNERVGVLILILIVSGLIFLIFSNLPNDQTGQAIDWKVFYNSTHGFKIDYPGNRVYSPPWVLALLWPFTIWSLPVSRGLAAAVTVAVFILSVPAIPNRWKYVFSVVLMVLAYPMIRHLLDGNLEAMIVGGVLLSVYAYRKKSALAMILSMVLLSSKVQESWLFLILLVIALSRDWPGKLIRELVLGIGIITIPFLAWKGGEWLSALSFFPYSQSLIDSSLRHILESMGISNLIGWVIWGFTLALTLWILFKAKFELTSRTAALLIISGMMLSNYLAGDSMVTALALGVIPVFQGRPSLGILLILFFFIPDLFVTRIDLRLALENIYWGGVLFITWAIFIWDCFQLQRSPVAVSPAL